MEPLKLPELCYLGSWAFLHTGVTPNLAVEEEDMIASDGQGVRGVDLTSRAGEEGNLNVHIGKPAVSTHSEHTLQG